MDHVGRRPDSGHHSLLSQRGGGRVAKELLQRQAAAAVRPASAIVGLGEHRGKAVARNDPSAAGARELGLPLSLQDPVQQAAMAAEHDAAAAHAAPDHGRVEMLPRELVQGAYCAGCRGEHKHENERSDGWQPYTPAMRLENLHALSSRFQVAFWRGELPVAISDDVISVSPFTEYLKRWRREDREAAALQVGLEEYVATRREKKFFAQQAVRWTASVQSSQLTAADGHQVTAEPLTPATMGADHFRRFLPLLMEGVREGHEPFRRLATNAVMELLDTRSEHLLPALPKCVLPLKRALETYEPSLVGHAMLVLQAVLAAHPGAGRVLTPYYGHFCPIMGLFRWAACQCMRLRAFLRVRTCARACVGVCVCEQCMRQSLTKSHDGRHDQTH